ncbi:MAG: pyridoxal-phosphate dependent enzyme, partial [Acidimicrobiia bacterium]|nr:pyridoxal-phosphate dependent enzyme [Acidimicrobiia bacterium]
LYPTGGGTGLIGMWKAFAELAQLGWLDSDRRPRMIACQAAGCAPIVTAFEAGARFAEPFPNPVTAASGLRVPAAVGDFMILDAVRESGGAAIAASEDRLLWWAQRASALEGISICPEAGACIAALEQMAARAAVTPDERIVIFNTGAAQKYVEVIRTELPELTTPVDWNRLNAL